MSKQNTDLGRPNDYIIKKLKSDIDNEYELAFKKAQKAGVKIIYTIFKYLLI